MIIYLCNNSKARAYCSVYLVILFLLFIPLSWAQGLHPNDNTSIGSFGLELVTPSGVVVTNGTHLFTKDVYDNPGGNSVVYEIGSGYGSTTAGQLAGVTFEISSTYSMAYDPVSNTIYNGKSTNSGYSIETYELTSEALSTESVPDGLLVPDTGCVGDSDKLLIASDALYIYNLAYSVNGGGLNGFTVKVFDPGNYMVLVRHFTSGMTSFEVRGCFADGDYLYAVEWTGDDTARILQIDAVTGEQAAVWRYNQGDTNAAGGCYDTTNDVVWMGEVGGSTVYKYSGVDAYDQVTYTATLNENSFTSGTEVSTQSGYKLVVLAEDIDGNTADETVNFVIGDADIKGRVVFSSREFYGDTLKDTGKLWDASGIPTHVPLPGGTRIKVIQNGATVLADGSISDNQGNFSFENLGDINPAQTNLTIKVYPRLLTTGATPEIVASVYTSEPGSIESETVTTSSYAVIMDNESSYWIFDGGEADPSIGLTASNGQDDDSGAIEKDTIIIPDTDGRNGVFHVLSVIAEGYDHMSSLFPGEDFKGLDVYLVDSPTRYDFSGGKLYISSAESGNRFNDTWNDGNILKAYAQFVLDKLGVSDGSLATAFEEATSGPDTTARPQLSTRDHAVISFRNALGDLLAQSVLNGDTDNLDSLNSHDLQFDFYPMDIIYQSSPGGNNPLAVVLEDNGSRLVLEEGDTIVTYPGHGITIETIGNDSVVMKVDSTDYTLALSSVKACSTGNVEGTWDTLLDLRKLANSEERTASDTPAGTPDTRRSNFLAAGTKHYSLFGYDNEAAIASALWTLCGEYGNSDSRVWTVVEKYKPVSAAAFKEAWDTEYGTDGQYVDFSPLMADAGLASECTPVIAASGITRETDTLYPQFEWKPSSFEALNFPDTGPLPSTATAFSYSGMKSALAGALSQEAYEEYEIKITDSSGNEEYASLDSGWVNPGGDSDYSDSYVRVTTGHGDIYGLVDEAIFTWEVAARRDYYGNNSVSLSVPESFQVVLAGATVETTGTGGSPVGGPTSDPQGDCSLAVPSGAFAAATVVVIDSFELDSGLVSILAADGFEIFSPVYEISFAGSLSQAATLTLTPDQALTGDEYDTGIYEVESIGSGAISVSFIKSDYQTGDFSAPITAAGKYLILRNIDKPGISDVTASNDPFSPDNDATRDTTDISFTLSKPAYISLEIYDGTSTLVRALLDDALKMAGDNSVAWDGKDDGPQVLTDETYTAKVNAYDSEGQLGSEVTSDIVLYTGTSGSFGGNGYLSGESDHTGIAISVTGTTLSTTTGSSGSFTIDQVPPGTYDVTFTFDDYTSVTVTNQSVTAGNTTTLSDQTLNLDSDIVAGLALNTSTISPNADGYRDKTRADFDLKQDADLTVKVYDSSSSLVKTLADWTGQAAGLYSVTWDGDDTVSQLVDDGTYTMQFSGTFDGSQSILTTEAQVGVCRNVYVLDFTLGPAEVSPNNDQVDDTVDIRFSLVYDSTVSLKIYDSDDYEVRELLASSAKNAKDGSNNLIVYEYTWDGKNGQSETVDNGLYTYTVALSTGTVSGITRSGTITVTGMDTVTPSVTSITSSPAQFTPNNPGNTGVKDESYVNVTVADNLSSRVKMDLVVNDSVDSLVNTFVSGVWKDTGSYSFVWFGKNNAGSYVSDGVYQYKARVEDEAGNVSGWFTDEVTVDNTNPTVANISFSPNPFFPSGNYSDPGYDTTTIQYDVNDSLAGDVTVTIVIKDEGSVVKRNLITSMSHQQGTHQTTWDGKNDGAQIVADGTYSCTIIVDDAAGNSASASLGSLVVDNTTPAAVSGLSAVEGDQLVSLDWDDWSAGGGPAFSEYRVYQSGTSFSSVSGLTPIHTINTLTSSQYTVTGLTNEIICYFAVTVKNVNGNENKTMTSEAATPYDDNAGPAKVADLVATPGDTLVDLTWTANTEEDLSHYNVYAGYAKVWETDSDFGGGTSDKVVVADNQVTLDLTDPASWDVLSEPFTNLSSWSVLPASGVIAEILSSDFLHMNMNLSGTTMEVYTQSLNTMTGEVSAEIRFKVSDYPSGFNELTMFELNMGSKAFTFKVKTDRVAVDEGAGDFEFVTDMDNAYHVWRFSIDSSQSTVDIFRDGHYLFSASTRSCSDTASVYLTAKSDGSDVIDCEVDYIKIASQFGCDYETPGTLNLVFDGSQSRDWDKVIFSELKASKNYSVIAGAGMTGEAEATNEHDKACDSNAATWWSSGAVGSWPLEITTDFGVAKSVKSLKYISESSGSSFAGKDYSIATSSDGSSWSSSIASGTLGNMTGCSYEVVEFTAVSTRYIKLSFSNGYDAGNYVKASEIQWLGDNSDTNIQVRQRTAATQGDLSSATWSSYSDTSEGTISDADSQFIEFEVKFTTVDTLFTPALDEIFVSYDQCSYAQSNTANSASYQKTGLSNGTEHSFNVSAEDISSNEGDRSDTARAKPVAGP